MSTSLRQRVNAELAALVEENGGRLRQEQVVAAARLRDTALHEDFERRGLWDDAKAAEIARLEYAGRLIRLYVVAAVDEGLPPVRALVSLVDDRRTDRGYRALDDVMSDPDLRKQMIETCLMELRAIKRKYDHLKELAVIWDAIPEPSSSAKRGDERATAG